MLVCRHTHVLARKWKGQGKVRGGFGLALRLAHAPLWEPACEAPDPAAAPAFPHAHPEETESPACVVARASVLRLTCLLGERRLQVSVP